MSGKGTTSGTKFHPGMRIHPIRNQARPYVLRRIFEELHKNWMTWEEVSKRSGVSVGTLRNMQLGKYPVGQNLEAVAGSVGMELTLRYRKGEEE